MGCPPRRAAGIQSGAGPKEGLFILQGATLESWSYFWRPTSFITSPRIEVLYAGHRGRLQCLPYLILVLLWSEHTLLCSESSLLEWEYLLWHSMLRVSCLFLFYKNSQLKDFRFSFILRAYVYVHIHRPRYSHGSQRTVHSWFFFYPVGHRDQTQVIELGIRYHYHPLSHPVSPTVDIKSARRLWVLSYLDWMNCVL